MPGGPGGPGGPGYPGAPYGQGGFSGEPVKPTDTISIVGFVLSLTCCLSFVGAILGFIGLGRTKNGQRKGRWAAISAIVLGILGTLALAGFIVALVLFASTPIDELKTGDCITASGIDPTDSGTAVTQIKVVECGVTHDGEVIGTKRLDSEDVDEFDFGNVDQLQTFCLDVVDPAKAAAVDAEYYLYGLTQTSSPDVGAKLVCLAVRADGGDITGEIQ